VLVEVLDLVVLQARDALLAALDTAPTQLGPLVRHGVRAVTDFLLADPRRGRVMFVESQVAAAFGRPWRSSAHWRSSTGGGCRARGVRRAVRRASLRARHRSIRHSLIR
jgi:hypothetical protein